MVYQRKERPDFQATVLTIEQERRRNAEIALTLHQLALERQALETTAEKVKGTLQALRSTIDTSRDQTTKIAAYRARLRELPPTHPRRTRRPPSRRQGDRRTRRPGKAAQAHPRPVARHLATVLPNGLPLRYMQSVAAHGQRTKPRTIHPTEAKEGSRVTRTKRAKAISKAAQEAKQKRANPHCPTPEKRSYTAGAAVNNALRSSTRAGRPMRIYRCPCGSLHLTQRVNLIAERKAA